MGGEEEITSSEAPAQPLADDVKEKLQGILTDLNKFVVILVENDEPIRIAFLITKDWLSLELAATLIPIAYIEGQRLQVLND